MNQKAFRLIEPILFIAFSVIVIIYFFGHRYVASLDGPQHLYTARLISELFQGDDFISTYFRFNPLIVGNLSSPYIMAFLMLFFPAWIAEKIYLICYVIGLAWSFRYLVKSITPTVSLLYLSIFPFAFSSLFMLGYYNFCLAFIPLFVTIGYFIRHEKALKFRHILTLLVLSTLLYITHAVVFVMFGMLIAGMMLFDLFYPVFKRDFNLSGMGKTIKKYAFILIAALPGIILWALYFLALNEHKESRPEISYISPGSILYDIYKLKVLIGFNHEAEAGPNTLVFWCIISLILISFIPFQKIFKSSAIIKTPKNEVWIKWTFITLMVFLLVLLIPDRFVTGSMTPRMILLFFFIVLTWISIQSYPKLIILVGIGIFLTSMIWHRQAVNKFYTWLNFEISEIQTAGKMIEPNSIIFPVNCSDNWVHLHFHCYLGVDKPLIDLRNPQANGPFSLVWNYYKMPNMLLGELDQKQADVYWPYGNNYEPVKKIDYVFFWKAGQMDKLEGAEELLNNIKPYYTEIYRSNNGNILLYRVNQPDTLN